MLLKICFTRLADCLKAGRKNVKLLKSSMKSCAAFSFSATTLKKSSSAQTWSASGGARAATLLRPCPRPEHRACAAVCERETYFEPHCSYRLMRSILTKLPYGDELATLEPLTLVPPIATLCCDMLTGIVTREQDVQFPEINMQQKQKSRQQQEQ